MNASNQLLIVLDNEGYIVSMNTAAIIALMYIDNKAKKKHFFEIVAPNNRDSVKNAYDKMQQENKKVSTKLDLQNSIKSIENTLCELTPQGMSTYVFINITEKSTVSNVKHVVLDNVESLLASI